MGHLGLLQASSSHQLVARATSASLDARLRLGSFRGYGDRLLLLLRFRRFRKRNGQDAVLEGGFDLVGVDAARHLERAAERAVAALGDVTVLSFLFLVF